MKRRLSRRWVIAAIGAGTSLRKTAAEVLGGNRLTTSFPAADPIGYSAIVQMFGSGASYNSDGTVTGRPNGAVYTYNPDAPDSQTTATAQDDFVSDFAGFTQGSVHCTRTDTPLRVYFRKDVSPNPNRIEIILELGHFTTTGSAPPNLGPFSLQILKGGVPQDIPVNTAAGAGNTWVRGGSTFTGTTQVTTAYFPSMGWWTRWRWNPTSRPIVRKNTQLLPSGLNLVPNFSNTLAQRYACRDTGTYGQLPYISAYSSAWSPSRPGYNFWNNYNPAGVNECTGLFYDLEAPGARPDIGLIPEWDANWICNGNGKALSSGFAIAEVGGGMPWCLRDGSTGWAPINFITNPNINLTSTLDVPVVTVPSSVGAGTRVIWGVQMNHHPCVGYIPYLLTGDPYYLENLQMYASYCVLTNIYIRAGQAPSALQNHSDPHSPTMSASPQAFEGLRYQARAWAWSIRTYTAAYLATPASAPSWLQPKSYFKSMLDINAAFADTWGDAYPGSSGNPAYAGLSLQGEMPDVGVIEEPFMIQYLQGALAFALLQGRITSWRPYTEYMSRMLVGMATGDGVTGWDKRFATPYQFCIQPFSTDYNVNPTAFTSMLDVYNYNINNCVYLAFSTDHGWWGWNSNVGTFAPSWFAWVPNTTYKCNSWIFEIRAGCPKTPNVGDVVLMTIAGPFAGSPVTVSHTVTANDNAMLINLARQLLDTGMPPNTHPIADPLIAAVNANSSLATAGITASVANTVPRAGGHGAGAFFTQAIGGRIYLSFDSTKPSSAYITVTGSFKGSGGSPTTSGCSLYIQPNGDGAAAGKSANAALFNRPLEYQVAKTTTTGSVGNAPIGTVLQTIITSGDGVEWCFVPELKSCPLMVPGGSSATFPQPGFGGAYGTSGLGTSYVGFGPAYMAGLVTGNVKGLVSIPNAQTAYNNLLAEWNYIFQAAGGGAGANSLFNLSIAP
jgi:hypothetical protein